MGLSMQKLLRLRPVLLTVVTVMLVHTAGFAREIYKWVDERGATHYGETLPDSDVASLEILDVTVVQVPLEASPRDFRLTLELANRMQADRLERERLLLAKAKLRLQQLEAELEERRINDTPPPIPYYGPYYRPYFAYPRAPYPAPPNHGKYPGYPPPPGWYPVPDVPKRVYLERR